MIQQSRNYSRRRGFEDDEERMGHEQREREGEVLIHRINRYVYVL